MSLAKLTKFCSFLSISSALYRNHSQMVDRYHSLVDSQIEAPPSASLPSSSQPSSASPTQQLLQQTNLHATRMREHISRYKRSTGPDETTIISAFKEEQVQLASDRHSLKLQLDQLGQREGIGQKNEGRNNHKEDRQDRQDQNASSEYTFMKRQLMRAVRNEIDLDLQLNQEITRRKEDKQQLSRRLISSSPLLSNALHDIEAKRADILYLERQINECLQLLEIIGVLTFERGQKLDEVSERVRRANEQIERAEANIDKAKINMQKSTCRNCCVILLALVVIALAVGVLFGFNIVSL